jgi:hypothetical protein
MKRSIATVAISLMALFTSVAFADLKPWEDYSPSEAVWQVTTIKVDANMDDAYLEGLQKTWVSGNMVSKELGQIEDWKILRSDLPQSGEFNLLLMVKYKSMEMAAPNEARYKAFVEKYTQDKLDETTDYSQKNYPAMRDITGMYYMREITLK